MKARVVITGAGGFVGQYMAGYLKQLQPAPHLIGVDISDSPAGSCDSFHKMDLSDNNAVADIIARSRPDYIIHLAGVFGTDDQMEIYRVNVLSMIALLEAVRAFAPDAVVVAAGSAAEYGHVEPDQIPVTEQAPCRPVTAYGLSKLLATQVALYYHRVFNTCVMVVRPFQLIGKGVTARLAPGAFAQQIEIVLSGRAQVIKVGNLDSSRDFLDVRDAAEAIWALCQKPAAGQVFNLCSGRLTKMSGLLDMMIDQCGQKVKVEADPARLRGKSDVSDISGSWQKLKDYCGWSPKRTLRESISEMFAQER